MEGLIRDIRYGLRMLHKSRGFAAIAILTLALGIGATTAIFSVVYGVLLRPLPYEKPNQIVQLSEVSANGHRMEFTDPNFEDVRSQSHVFDGVAEYVTGPESVSGDTQPSRVSVALVSHDFLSLMRVAPVMGRGFAPEDEHFGAAPTALISYAYWRDVLGAPRDLSSIKLKIDNQAVSVVGVLPVDFHFPDDTAIWEPRELRERFPSRSAHNWRVVGRLRDGVTPKMAYPELSTIARRIKQQYGDYTDITDIAVVRLQDALTSDVRPALLILSGAVGFLLLIACANVVNLLLAQASTRSRELALRTAIGADRVRLVRQFLTEALLLSFAGGAAGVLAARWGVIALARSAPSNFSLSGDVSISLPVLAFASGLSFLIAIGLGVGNALQATSGNVQQALAEHGRSQMVSPRSHRIGRIIVGGQIAITIVLLTGAGLLGRSLLRVLSIDPGFRTEHIITMDLALTFAKEDAEKLHRIQFLSSLLDKLRAIPGVHEVGGTGRLPLTEALSDGTYVEIMPGDHPPKRIEELEDWYHSARSTGYANYVPASEGYFRAIGIPLIRGRWFDDRDVMDAPHVALINQSMAKDKWPGQDPIGRTIEFGNMDGDLRPITIIGVVGDAREMSVEIPPSPTVYVNYRQRPQATYRFTTVLQADTDPATVITDARAILRDLDPNVPPVFDTFAEVFSTSLRSRRFSLTLVCAFAGTALLLAMTGLYGVMAFAVARRTGEFGVRIALGASSGNILRLVIVQGIRTTLVGVAIGVIGALALARTLQSFLFGLSANDPLTIVVVGSVLVLIAMLACYVPARRAAKVDPIVSLRYE
ncbi:MAG: ABC transporter permease [Candidatus Sulfotelmatobacter sp.]